MRYNTRGRSYSELGKNERAIEDYDKAIELDPDDDGAYNNRGFSYRRLGQYQRAIEDFDKAIELDPNFAGAYNNRGFSYRNLGRYQRALDDDNSETARRGINAADYVAGFPDFPCSFNDQCIKISIKLRQILQRDFLPRTYYHVRIVPDYPGPDGSLISNGITRKERSDCPLR